MISGLHLAGVRLAVAFDFLIVAFRFTRNPAKAVSLIAKLLAERRDIHENSGEIKAVKAGGRYYWSINMPGWPSAAFRSFAANEFKRILSPGDASLQTVILSVSSRCPLRCSHCYEWENLSETELLTEEQLQDILLMLKDKGLRHLQFSGGEPMARFETMLKLMDLGGRGIEYWINTSGYGLTYEKAAGLKQHGMAGAVISLDHWDESEHNALRNNSGSYRWALDAAVNCKKTGLAVSFSLCPVRDFTTRENLEKYIGLAMNAGAGFIRILEPRDQGRFSGKDVKLTNESVRVIDEFMMAFNNDMKRRSYPIIQFPGHHQRKSGCMGAGNRYIFIDSKGDYHACPFCRDPLGNAMTIPLETAVLKARERGCHVFRQKALSETE